MMRVMSETDRELRDRLEAAQADLQRANKRLDELERVAADRDVLRSQLDVAQAELKQANERLVELEGQSVEALEDELDEVTRDRDLLRQRLEQADKTREQWDQKVAARDAELAAARALEQKLKQELDEVQAPDPRTRPPGWVFVMPFVSMVIAALVALRSC
jgi:chromosome segregation ATPase